MRRYLLCTLITSAFSAVVIAQSPVRVRLDPFATGLPRITDIVHAGDDRIFAVLQPGVIRIVRPDGSVAATPFLNISGRVNDNGNEQGLLGMAFDPDHASNGWFYVCYTAGQPPGISRVSRFTVTENPNVADPASEEVLFTCQQPYTNHNGGDLDFGPDGYLYVALGDGGNAGDPDDHAQNMTSPLGKILRIDVHGDAPYAIPPDNPFVNSGDTLPEIWASGLRNPWRFGFDALTGDLWIGDVGQNSREEVNFWPAGDNSGPNFGWRCYEGDLPFNTEGCLPEAAYVPPVRVHTTANNQWCSVIGGRVYRGETYWRLAGRYIYADYCLGRFVSLRPNGSGGWTSQQVLPEGVFGTTCIGEDHTGELYAGNSNNGVLYRIVDVCPQPRPVIEQTGEVLTAPEAEGYLWSLNGEPIPGATERSITAEVSGYYTVLVDHGDECQLLSDTLQVVVTRVGTAGSDGLSVYPIPAKDRLVLKGLPDGNTQVDVLDMTGRLMFSREVRVAGGETIMDVRGLPSGNYVLQVDMGAGSGPVRRTVSVER